MIKLIKQKVGLKNLLKETLARSKKRSLRTLKFLNRPFNLFVHYITRDENVFIPHEYIQFVMDFEKMRMFPWSLQGYDELIASILKAGKDVHLKKIYVFDGFSIAF